VTIEKNKWISVKDAMPPIEKTKGFSLIMIDKYGFVTEAVSFDKKQGLFEQLEGYHITDSTHWMLLSKPSET
jgi:hypothetical protein